MKSNSDYTNDGDYGGEYAAPKWFEKISEDPKTLEKVSDQVLIELKEEAKKILDSEIANYNIKNAKTNTDYRWMKTVMMKGTISDKIAAYTVLIQDNPIYNLETIRNVIGMVKVGKKKECIAVIETLTELFLSDLLRPNEKLRLFYDRPLSQLGELSSGNAITRRKYLSHWYFEDQLKEAYHTFVQALNTAAHDTVDSNKEKAVAAMSSLLAGNPEQEKNLLSHIINKLGDPSQKVASKAMYCLTQVLKQHSNMQGVVLKEIEKLLFRANIGHKAQYYSLCFISQFYLCAENPEVAQKLIEVYFSFFKKCIKEGDVDSRMMSVLLIGVNRAYPYANLDLNSISEHINTMYRVVHVSNLNVALNALSLLFQVSQCADSVNDRFYSALYRKLMDSKLPSCTNQAILLNLLYKSMLRDDKNERIIAFIKRLLQIALIVQSNFACGIIFLISQLLAKKTCLSLMHLKIVEPEIKIENDSDDEEKYTDVKDDDEEKYTDVKDEDDGDNQKETGENDQNVVGWVHRQDSQKVKVERKEKNYYDPFARNPLFAQAQLSAYCELLELKNHYHPSVRLFAEHMLKGKKIVYSGDPLKDFTLIRFLERFVFKNPKKVDEMPSASTFSKRKYYQPQGIRSIAVLSNDFLSQSEKNIPVDELFLYTYMRKRYKDVKIKEDDDESDLESVASEEFEDMLSKMSGLKDDEDEDELDFMNEVGTNIRKQEMANKKQKKKSDDGSEEESDDDGDEDEDEDLESHISDDDEESEDLSMNAEDCELLGDLSEDDDDELFLGDDDDEDDLMLDSEDEPKVKAKPKAKKGSGSVFAAAEEFASLLEDEGNSKIAPGSSNQMENSDKAGTKQLDWEDKRNRWIKGYNSALGKGGKGKPFKGGNDKGQKRPNKSGQSHKNKKHKK